MNCIALLLNWALCGWSFQYILVFNFTNMHALSHRSDFVPCSRRVNIWKPAGCFSVSFLSAVFRVGFPCIIILTTTSESKSLNSSLLEVMISSKNEQVFIRDLRDLTLQIVFDVWWSSMNVGSKWHVAWNDSRQATSWRFYLHCGMEETGSTGTICIDCHQVLCHPSKHGTSSMGKHLLAKAEIAKLNELTESKVTELTSSMVDEMALAILKRQGSWGITIVSLQRKITSDIQVNPYWPQWQTQCSKRQIRTVKYLNFTKTHGIVTSC